LDTFKEPSSLLVLIAFLVDLERSVCFYGLKDIEDDDMVIGCYAHYEVSTLLGLNFLILCGDFFFDECL
jgi:hypothetical protein